ncbi:MAG: hypothetical protein K0R99_650 [Microbacterium sp.]|jgi:hypothetical protein|uniref:hypothetical protein n=1 Tax=Microbacterium sp. TaxID=51671 RepID=UPI00262F8011|nr:hypothetical protein [Microbacterium sp.]MDF2559204.1 hypothetical protein [Microbacterium sp.]
MDDHLPSTPDLTGTVDDRQRQLAALSRESLTAEWLRQQLDDTLRAWSATETELDISREGRADY